MIRLKSYSQGNWVEGKEKFKKLYHPITNEVIGEISSCGIDFNGMVKYARETGGSKLREMTFHQRARMLKEMAQYLMSRKEEFYPLSYMTGATKIDSWIDIEGGISTFFTYASKGRRELPDEIFYVDGASENLSKNGTFIGQHICVPLHGVAVHINAFNFPCWGMLEKLAPTFLAGMPAIVKPASATAYLTEALVRVMVESKILPEGTLQLICGDTGDLLNHLGGQDVITFTGSAETGIKLKSHPNIIRNSIRFNMEADSLNCSILGPDVSTEMEEFNLFIKEVVNEMTTKAGQKCTAIRRTIVPASQLQNVVNALKERLAKIKIGNPKEEGIRMGPLVGISQAEDVKKKIAVLKKSSEVVYETAGNDGAFMSPLLLQCNFPLESDEPHEIEAFGPVNTVMAYNSLDDAIKIANKGGGSLVGSLFTADNEVAKKIVMGIGSYHGRIMIINKECAKESTGHGSPMPHLTHGGPGRAGGGEELGGIRGIMKYMQRVALQGDPSTISIVCNQWIKGARQISDEVHPFKKYCDELQIGETYITKTRTVTENDVINFANISGDYFYAHFDDDAARASIFEKRVVHGYFVLSASAGLFVDPDPGPVLANYGLENLRFTKPVYIGDTIQTKLICKQKTAKEKREGEIPQGIVVWYVEVTNQNLEIVAVYDILTLVKRKEL
ncbi:MAG: phenylacetic acid degradation bifunctional protein PaaZ [Ignavibacteriales bacterium]|nr:phenylacetic acid degradation bifunctional protein PaaZ [Ignavibacteriales bacterium]